MLTPHPGWGRGSRSMSLSRARGAPSGHDPRVTAIPAQSTPAADPVGLADVLAARRRIRPHLPPTAFRSYPGLTDAVGAEVWVKHENHNPTAAFKVRGGVNLVARLGDDERTRGLISASTGNHGQSIAYAARLFGVPQPALAVLRRFPMLGPLLARLTISLQVEDAETRAALDWRPPVSPEIGLAATAAAFRDRS